MRKDLATKRERKYGRFVKKCDKESEEKENRAVNEQKLSGSDGKVLGKRRDKVELSENNIETC